MVEEDEDVVMKAAPPLPTKVQPWCEKFRPRSIDDIAYQDEVVKTLKNAISTGVLPHLLFYGPPGTGKTSTILAVARTLFGPDTYKSRILELNASDERGIKIVREKVKNFAQTAVGLGASQPGYPCPPFKIIILDEADTMTPEAQAALRRTMETYSKMTRFCLICNYVTRIIEPLASRCAKFRFRALSTSTMLGRLHTIAAAESVSISEQAMDAIIGLSGGDMRKAVTTLQSAHQLYGGAAEISADVLTEVSGKVPTPVVEALWAAMRSNSFRQLQEAVDAFVCEGYPLSALLLRLQEDIVTTDKITDARKAIMCEKLAEVDKRLIDGSDEDTQLLDTAALIMRQLHLRQ